MSKQMRGSLMLLFTAAIWGASFVAQKEGMNYIGPHTFNAARMLLSGLAIIPVIAVLDKLRGGRASGENRGPALRGDTLLGGVLCGVALFVAATFQQLGVLYTTAGKSAFITTLYIVLVPLMGLVLRKRVPRQVWLGVALAVAGLYLLCIQGDFSMSQGDLLSTAGAFWFAVHILIIDRFSSRVDGVRLACVQFFVCALLSMIAMALLETPSPGALLAAWLPLLYSGLLSGCVGFTLQIIAQRDTPPAVASLMMSLESVFAVLAGGLLLGEVLSVREAAGCVLMFGAILLTQVRVGAKTPHNS